MTETMKRENIDIAWCPGCGNFAIRNVVAQALENINIDRKDLVFVSGIGQAAKAPQYLNVSFFNGLHGRALPPATGIKAANPKLTVIVESGDGDMYGEGGNHFIHTIRRNPNITVIAHNNMVYGLTKGQASPTSQREMVTPVQVDGVRLEPFNPLSTAIALDASFVARANAGDRKQAESVIQQAVQHRGFALVDIFQTCVTFNKVNNYKWFKEHTYTLDEDHDPQDRTQAFQRAVEKDPLPLGVFYVNEDKLVFEESFGLYEKEQTPLFKREVDLSELQQTIEEKKESQ